MDAFWPCLSLVLGSAFTVAMTREKAPAFHGYPGYQRDQRLTVWDGTVAIFSCVMGLGVLSMPYALSQADLVAAPLILLVEPWKSA